MQPDADVLIAELRRAGEAALADLIDKAQYGSTGSEILGDIGAALFRHREVKAKLGPEGKQAWNNLRAEVDRAYPGWSFRSLFSWRKK